MYTSKPVLVIIIMDSIKILHEMKKIDFGKNIENTKKTKHSSLCRFNNYSLFFGRN